MEHNHGKLWQGFSISFLMFGLGIFLAFIGGSSNDFNSKILVYFFAFIMIIGGTKMLRDVFKTRDNCPICKDRYQWNRKK